LRAHVSHASPNWDERPPGAVVEAVVLHYTGMPSAADALARLRDPAAKVSAHYLILEDGQLLSLVPEEHRAWHAGRSFWRGRQSLNDVAVGIELANPGHAWGYRPFPASQVKALVDLTKRIMERWQLPPEAILAHSDIAPDRKQDPGERLDWRALAEVGIGHWPKRIVPAAPCPGRASTLLELVGYGAETTASGRRHRLVAFQRRFRPQRVDGWLDPVTMGAIDAVAALCGPLRGHT
jgi:N-acetylmuramoyl-L-alanine amidase